MADPAPDTATPDLDQKPGEEKGKKKPATIDDRIAALELKIKQAKALKQREEARKKAANQKADRAKETRMKILVGAYFLQVANTSDENKQTLRKRLDTFLTRADDRALFDLQPLPVVPAQPA